MRYKNILKSKNRMLLLAFAFLLISQIYFVFALDAPLASSYWSGYGTSGECNGPNDLVVQILPGACTPATVRSDLLEENANTPVFCQMTAVKFNPFIDISSIKSVTARMVSGSQGVSVSYYPARAALRTGLNQALNSPFANNIGYLVVILSKQPSEKKMPDSVKANVELTINYKSNNAFGFGKSQLYSKEITSDMEDYWRLNYNQYSFFQGKVFLRVESIGQDTQGDYVNVGVYKDSTNRVSLATLRPGKSESIWLPDSYCQASMSLVLNSIELPKTHALISVNDEKLWVREKDQLAESGCTVRTIDEENNNVIIDCPGKQLTLELLPPNAELSFKNEAGETTSNKKYAVGDELIEYNAAGDEVSSKVYMAYIGDTRNAAREFRQNVPDKDFIVVADFSNSSIVNQDVFKTIGFAVNRLITTQRELKSFSFLGKTDTVWKSLLKDTVNLITPGQGKASLESLTKAKVTDIPGLEAELNNAFQGKITFKVILLGDSKESKDLGKLKEITFIEKNKFEDNKYTSEPGKLLEEYYQKAVESYQNVYQSYGTENIVGDYADSDKTFGEVALDKLAKLSFYIGKKYSAYSFYNEIISAYKNKNSAEKAQSAIETIANNDFTKSTKSAYINSEMYTFTLQNIMSTAFADNNAEFTVNGKRDAYGEGDYLDEDGKISLYKIQGDKAIIHLVEAGETSSFTTIGVGENNKQTFGAGNSIEVVVKKINYDKNDKTK